MPSPDRHAIILASDPPDVAQYLKTLDIHAETPRVGYRPFIFSRRGGQSPRNASIMTGPIVDDHGRLHHALTITTLGWSLRPLQRFIGVCREFRRHNLTGTTTVYFAGAGSDPYGQGWQSVSKTIRKLDTIDMDQDLKLEIVRDAEYYYSDQWYVSINLLWHIFRFYAHHCAVVNFSPTAAFRIAVAICSMGLLALGKAPLALL